MINAKCTSKGNLLFVIDHEYIIPDNNGPIILPNAAKDCENPLILPKYFFSPELLIIKFTNIIDIVDVDPFNIKNKLEKKYNTIFDNLFISDNNDIINNVNGFKNCTVKNKSYVPYLFLSFGITITENNIKNIADIINIMPIEVELKFNPLFSFDVANNSGNKLSLPIRENLILK